MSRAEGESEGGSGGGVRELWVQGVCVGRLSCVLIMPIERGVSHVMGISRGKFRGREFGGTNARRCDMVGMAFFLHGVCWEGLLQSYTQFIGSEYQ